MAERRLKTKVVAPAARDEAAGVALVGTYRARQLAWMAREGVYNWPVKDGDAFDAAALGKVGELWLYADAKGTRHAFAATFAGRMTRAAFLAAHPSYASRVGAPTHTAYYVFKATPLGYGPGLENPVVLVRAGDFGPRTAKVRKAIERFQADGAFAPLEHYLPADLARVPSAQLRVCEPGVQMDFMAMMFPERPVERKDGGYSTADDICESLGCQPNVPGWPDEFGRSLKRFVNQNAKTKIRTLSLFSGAGGLDIGFSDAGFDIIESVEIEKKFCETLELNSGEGRRFPHSKVNCVDIREFSGRNIGPIDFIIGGPPCQTFSAAGRRANGVLGTTDARGVLFREYVRLLGELHPRGFLFENVYGLTGAQGGEAWREIQDSFAEAGYRIFSRILDAADYGVPQHRERLIIVGLRAGEYKFPRPTYGPDSLAQTPFYTAGMAVRGLRLTAEEAREGLGGRFGRLLDDIPPGLNYSFYTREMGHPNPVFAWRSKFSDFLYKADPEAPVRTIKAQGGAYTGPLHWNNRFFACSEYKRLQTFPDDYAISGGKQVAVKQIGNSVPPQLARMLAISIQEQVFGANFPFRLAYLPPDEKLTFRSRKLGRMNAYREKASAEMSKMTRSPQSLLPPSCTYFCRLSDKFKFDTCAPCSGAYRVDETWGGDLSIRVSDSSETDCRDVDFSIEIRPSGKTWDLPIPRVLLTSYSPRLNSFTVAWKAFENAIVRGGFKADLVQLNGYYQYSPSLRCSCAFSAPFKYAGIISSVVSGENVRRIISEADLGRAWAVRPEDVVEVASVLRKIGYEVRNNKTNPQISPGQWLIPYAFPSLNHMSVQLGKEIR